MDFSFVFIINPVAGKGKFGQELEKKLATYFATQLVPYETYVTTKPMAALSFIIQYPQIPHKRLCFVSCGGDGTLNEVVNGAMQRGDCCVGVLPFGSGNDFVKNFGQAEDFLNLENWLIGKETVVDLLSYDGQYAVNLCNIGFDATVAKNMNLFKKLPFVSGKLAYNLSVVYSLLHKLHFSAQIKINGRFFKEDLLLMVVANGICYGGGYYPTPEARVNDGLMDFCAVRRISRGFIAKLIGIYKTGKHINNPSLENMILYERCTSLEITSGKPMTICVDGEIFLKNKLCITVKQGCLPFFLPQGCEIHKKTDIENLMAV